MSVTGSHPVLKASFVVVIVIVIVVILFRPSACSPDVFIPQRRVPLGRLIQVRLEDLGLNLEGILVELAGPDVITAFASPFVRQGTAGDEGDILAAEGDVSNVGVERPRVDLD